MSFEDNLCLAFYERCFELFNGSSIIKKFRLTQDIKVINRFLLIITHNLQDILINDFEFVHHPFFTPIFIKSCILTGILYDIIHEISPKMTHEIWPILDTDKKCIKILRRNGAKIEIEYLKNLIVSLIKDEKWLAKQDYDIDSAIELIMFLISLDHIEIKHLKLLAESETLSNQQFRNEIIKLIELDIKMKSKVYNKYKTPLDIQKIISDFI